MRPLLKFALWSGSVGAAAVLVRRFVRRRRAAIDVGPVSEEWLAHRRGVADQLQY